MLGEPERRTLASAETLRSSRDGVVDTQPWERNWLGDRSGSDFAVAPPVALELRLTLAEFGELRRLYVLPSS